MARLVQVSTPLGDDSLIFRSLTGTEQLGGLFEYQVELVAKDEQIDFLRLLGRDMTVGVVHSADYIRYFHGYISRFTQVGHVGKHALYSATLRPWFWFLTRTADCRIYHPDLTAYDIIQEVFADYGFATVDDTKLEKKFRVREYTVQYRETDFAFVSRLMEEEGIYYYFRHEDGKHTMVLCNSTAAHEPIPGCESLPYHALEDTITGQTEYVSDWYVSQEIQTGRYTATDYCFETPRAAMEVRAKKAVDVPLADLEVFDYPGVYKAEDEGKACAAVRIEEMAAQFERAHGVCNARLLASGGLFTLAGHPREDQNKEYLVVSMTHDLKVQEQESGGDQEDVYRSTFSVLDSKITYRPPRATPRPMIRGPQTAIVVGPDGEEIYTDKYGRVRVQFFWDREGKFDQDSSCWIRVASVWAGHGWGGIQIPRIGQEVIVEFLEGDPDRPIITGRVYNADAMPPFELPVNMTKSGLRSHSSKGAGSNNFNEFHFEDKKGSEQVYLHAEKDWKIDIKNAETETVGASISTSAGGSISRSAGADHSRTADKNIADKAGVNISTDSGKNMALKAGGSYSLLTNLGIQLKAMNFFMGLIESGAKDAAEKVKKGFAGGAAGSKGDIAGRAEAGAGQAYAAGAAAAAPLIMAVTADLAARQDAAVKGMTNLEAPVAKAVASMDALKTSIESGASPEATAEAFIAAASAAADAYKDAAKIVEEMLPQIPSITLWAMKDINQRALWSMSLSTKVKDIDIKAENKNINIKAKKTIGMEAEDTDVNIKAKKNVNLEASEKNLSLKATKKDLVITAKEKVSIKAEDKDFIIEAGKTKVTVKAAKQIAMVCGKASICLKEGGDVLIKGGKITLKGTEALTAKGNPIKLN